MATAPSHIRTVRVHAATREGCGDGIGAAGAQGAHAALYTAHVGHGLLDGELGRALAEAAQAINGVAPRRVLIVHDSALPSARVEAVASSCRAASLEVAMASLRADEKDKSFAAVEGILAAAVGAKLERTDCYVAIGGGIVGDLTGFAAGIYRRGIAWCNIPTTLLSMVDASIGGKTGCNLGVAGSLLKNMAGVFHDPALVICDTATLATLPPRELVAGLAECVKHAMIERSVPADTAVSRAGPSLWSRLDSLAREMADGPVNPASLPASLVDLIADNLALKARVVAADPFETASDAEGGRALLNLGHTFGHALETMDGLVPRAVSAPTASAITRSAPMSHGEAVALGLVAACVAGEALGTCAADTTKRVETLLAGLGLPTRVDGLSLRINEALARLRHDKKARGGTLRIIVPVSSTLENPAECGLSRIFSNPSDDALRAAFEHVSR